jgi:hypothetical protein
MDRLLAERLWGIPWSVLALVALGMMVVYLVLDTSHGASGVNWFILRWFHSLCWLLLALAALAMAKITPIPSGWASSLAAAGGLTYAVFMVTSLVSGKLGG